MRKVKPVAEAVLIRRLPVEVALRKVRPEVEATLDTNNVVREALEPDALVNTSVGITPLPVNVRLVEETLVPLAVVNTKVGITPLPVRVMSVPDA